MKFWFCLLLIAGAASLAAQTGYLSGDVNADGVVNAADYALVLSVLNHRTEALAAADVDGDGAVTTADAEAVADRIAGLGTAHFCGAGNLGPSGGSFTAGDLTVTAGAGALENAVTLHVYAAPAPAHAAPNYEDSECYRVEGLPLRHGAGLVLALPGSSADQLEIGSMVTSPSSPLPRESFARVMATAGNGQLSFALPPLEGLPKTDELAETRVVLVRRRSGFGVREGNLDGTRSPTRFYTLVYPQGMNIDLYEPAIRTALRDANLELRRLGFRVFDPPISRSTPVEIRLSWLNGACGYFVPSELGRDYGYLELNLDHVMRPALASELRRTVYHEFAHLLQGYFDPRCAFVIAKFNSPQLWLDESFSVWLERYAIPGTTSSFMADNSVEVLRGLHVACSGLAAWNTEVKETAQEHGYGMSMLWEYLFHHRGAPVQTAGKEAEILLAIYTEFLNQGDPEAAVRRLPPVRNWWNGLVTAFAEHELGAPPVPFQDMMYPTSQKQRVTFLKLGKNTGFVNGAIETTKKQLTTPGRMTVGANYPAMGFTETRDLRVNLMDSGLASGRRMMAELSAPAARSEYTMTARVSCEGGLTPLAATAVSKGVWGGRAIWLAAAPAESSFSGKRQLGTFHILTTYCGEDAPEAVAVPETTSIWCFDTQQTVRPSVEPFTSSDLEPKEITYTLTGKVTAPDAVAFREHRLYFDATLKSLAAEGGAAFYLPAGTSTLNLDLTMTAAVADTSNYVIKQYRISVWLQYQSGQTERIYTNTYLPESPKGGRTAIQATVTVPAEAEYLDVSLESQEDITAGNGIFSLNSWFHPVAAYRYAALLKQRYGTPSNTRRAESALSPIAGDCRWTSPRPQPQLWPEP